MKMLSIIALLGLSALTQTAHAYDPDLLQDVTFDEKKVEGPCGRFLDATWKGIVVKMKKENHQTVEVNAPKLQADLRINNRDYRGAAFITHTTNIQTGAKGYLIFGFETREVSSSRCEAAYVGHSYTPLGSTMNSLYQTAEKLSKK